MAMIGLSQVDSEELMEREKVKKKLQEIEQTKKVKLDDILNEEMQQLLILKFTSIISGGNNKCIIEVLSKLLLPGSEIDLKSIESVCETIEEACLLLQGLRNQLSIDGWLEIKRREHKQITES